MAPQNNAETSAKLSLVRSMMAVQNPNPKELTSLLRALITSSAPINVPLTAWLAKSFYSTNYMSTPLFGAEEWLELRRHARDQLSRHFVGVDGAEKLTRALKSDDDSHFAALHDLFDPRVQSEPLALPEGFAAALTEVARQDPDFGVPIISSLLAPPMMDTTSPTSAEAGGRQCSPLQEERIKSFAQESIRHILNHYQIDSARTPSAIRPFIEQAQNWARTWPSDAAAKRTEGGVE
jgi:hypothetical protein